MIGRLVSLVHNCIAHPLWVLSEQAADAAQWLHDVTAPPTERFDR